MGENHRQYVFRIGEKETDWAQDVKIMRYGYHNDNWGVVLP